MPKEVGGNETCLPENVHLEMSALLKEYNSKKKIGLDDIIEFHQRFEAIHPFQDGNGRVGRLVMFKECLANGIVPFIITDDLRLRDTCLTAQDKYKALLDYFRIKY